MITKNQFRAALSLSMLLGFLGLTAFFLGQARLPAPLREYLETTRNAEPTGLGWALFAIGIPLITSSIASFVGMLRFKHWSRALALATCIPSILLLPLFGPTVEPGITTALYYASCMLFGAVLSLAYYSSLGLWPRGFHHHFQRLGVAQSHGKSLATAAAFTSRALHPAGRSSVG